MEKSDVGEQADQVIKQVGNNAGGHADEGRQQRNPKHTEVGFRCDRSLYQASDAGRNSTSIPNLQASAILILKLDEPASLGGVLLFLYARNYLAQRSDQRGTGVA